MTQHRKSQCARWRTGGCTAGGIEHKAIHGYRRLGESKIVRTLIPAHQINGIVDKFIQRGPGVVVMLRSTRPICR